MSYKTRKEVELAMTQPNTVLIGLSLSYCIREMVKDPSLNVLYIIAGTKSADSAAFKKVLEFYKGTYWQDCQKEAVELAHRLWKEGRIMQPRTLGCTLSIADGYWLILEGYWIENASDPIKEVMKQKLKEIEQKKEFDEWLYNLVKKGIVNKCQVCGEPIPWNTGVCKKHD